MDIISSAHLDVDFSCQDFGNGNRLNKLHETWKMTCITFSFSSTLVRLHIPANHQGEVN